MNNINDAVKIFKKSFYTNSGQGIDENIKIALLEAIKFLMEYTAHTGHISETAIKKAALRSYEYEGDKKGIFYIGFYNEDDLIQASWEASVREAILGALPYLFNIEEEGGENENKKPNLD